jgi:hypothetical protein
MRTEPHMLTRLNARRFISDVLFPSVVMMNTNLPFPAKVARRLLLDKVEAIKKGYVTTERAAMEKIRRHKRRRSRRARARMLADKSHHAAKKEGRRFVAGD